jgi:hypothetical protein
VADIFVSYARKDRPRVAEISGALEQSGYHLWWDRRLESGADYGMLIERELDAAGCVVVAWSDAARRSLWVRAEANEALDAGKLVQISLDQSRLPLPFTMLHYLDFNSWRGETDCEPWTGFDARLARMLRGEPVDELPPMAETPPVRAPAPEAPLQAFGPAIALGWTAIVLAALMAIAVAAAATGALPAASFGMLAATGLAIAAIVLALVAWMMVRTLTASRR